MSYVISIIGLGYVGVTSMACLSKMGHKIIGVDVNEDKVALIGAGKSPIEEPQVPQLIEQGIKNGQLTATMDAAAAIRESDAIFVCVGTPSLANGDINTTYLDQVMKKIAVVRRETGRCIPVFVRSTALPTVHQALIELLQNELGNTQPTAYCVHPEFLREGQAVYDFYNPPKTVYGCTDEAVAKIATGLYPEIDDEDIITDPMTAALVKYADNCFHAVKVTFGNEIGQVAKAFGVDSREVMDIFCKDTKLNISPKYLMPGMPFGGSCLPKDLRGISSWARRNAISLPMLENVNHSNAQQIEQITSNILKTGKMRIGLIGLAFKDDTDDLREAPMVVIAEQLMGKGREVQIYDPLLNTERLIGANQNFALSALPHLARMMVEDCQQLVKDNDLIIIAQQRAVEDFNALPWHGEQTVFDLVGLKHYAGMAGVVEGLYWNGNMDGDWQLAARQLKRSA